MRDNTVVVVVEESFACYYRLLATMVSYKLMKISFLLLVQYITYSITTNLI